ncbi:MAG: branched-chain amino acid ABC transporter permease [Chloroflexota bacterium]|nr:branched-chain amino acid ABC transporter permease [Chloroflexota bacterium]
MEAQAVPESSGLPLRERVRETSPVQLASRHPQRTAIAAVLLFVLILIVTNDLQQVAQTGLNGLALGSVYALGAVGLTLVYGILKLVNFAHGEFLTFGAYMAFVANVSFGLPLVVAALVAIALTAVLGLAFERVMWAPMRARGAGLLQLLIMSIGLAFLIRYLIQFFAGTDIRYFDFNRSDTIELLGLSLGLAQFTSIIVGLLVLGAIGLLLKLTLLGKQMRALSDDVDLAETAGIDTSRVILYTWLLAGGAAGLAGGFAGAVTDIRPELGFTFLLAIFAAVIVGGIGDVFGALVGGLLLGLVIEWSTLFIDFRYKTVIGFVVLILVLILRPQGIFGKAKAV